MNPQVATLAEKTKRTGSLRSGPLEKKAALVPAQPIEDCVAAGGVGVRPRCNPDIRIRTVDVSGALQRICPRPAEYGLAIDARNGQRTRRRRGGKRIART